MSTFDHNVEKLLAKNPSLTKPEAINILMAKNERKKAKRQEKTDRSEAKRLKNEANRPPVDND
jgi:uncharacterized protein YneF (UPF0154 family)